MGMALANKGTGVMLLLAALLAFLFSAAAVHSYIQQARESPRYGTYIVLLWTRKDADAMDKDAHRRWHQSFLPSTLTDSGEPRLLHSYIHVFNGFAARLTDAELEEVAKKPGFLHAFPNRTGHLLGMPGYQRNGTPRRQRGVRRRRRAPPVVA